MPDLDGTSLRARLEWLAIATVVVLIRSLNIVGSIENGDRLATAVRGEPSGR